MDQILTVNPKTNKIEGMAVNVMIFAPNLMKRSFKDTSAFIYACLPNGISV